jgi:hypothetical protein
MMPTPTRGLSQTRCDRIATMFMARDDVIIVLTNTVATVLLCILGEPIPSRVRNAALAQVGW